MEYFYQAVYTLLQSVGELFCQFIMSAEITDLDRDEHPAMMGSVVSCALSHFLHQPVSSILKLCFS